MWVDPRHCSFLGFMNGYRPLQLSFHHVHSSFVTSAFFRPTCSACLTVGCFSCKITLWRLSCLPRITWVCSSLASPWARQLSSQTKAAIEEITAKQLCLVTVKDGIKRIVLDHSAKRYLGLSHLGIYLSSVHFHQMQPFPLFYCRNALSFKMLSELLECISAPADDVRVIIISANGPVFSSGHDLKELVRAVRVIIPRLWRPGLLVRMVVRSHCLGRSNRSYSTTSMRPGAVFAFSLWTVIIPQLWGLFVECGASCRTLHHQDDCTWHPLRFFSCIIELFFDLVYRQVLRLSLFWKPSLLQV